MANFVNSDRYRRTYRNDVELDAVIACAYPIMSGEVAGECLRAADSRPPL